MTPDDIAGAIIFVVILAVVFSWRHGYEKRVIRTGWSEPKRPACDDPNCICHRNDEQCGRCIDRIGCTLRPTPLCPKFRGWPHA